MKAEDFEFDESKIEFEDIFLYFLKLADEVSKDEALKFFDRYVAWMANLNSLNLGYALECGKRNFGYFSGYFSFDIQEKTQKILNCEHPIFGKAEEYRHKDASYFFDKSKESINTEK